LTENGEVFAWGKGDDAQLGLLSREHKMLPARVGGDEVFGGACAVVVAAGVCERERPTPTHTYMHTHTRTYTHTRTDQHTHTHTHTHMH